MASRGRLFVFSRQPSGKGNWTAPQVAFGPFRVRAGQPRPARSHVGLGLRALSDWGAPTSGGGPCLPSSYSLPPPAPRARAGRGRLLRDPASSCRHQPRLSRCCRLPPAPRCGARLRWPSPRSSHDGGCSQQRRAPGARWGRRARGGSGGRGGLELMSPFVSPQLHLLPWCAGPGDPAGRPGRRPRLPLGGGPRSKFCFFLALGTLPPQPWPLGVVPGRVPCRAAPSPRRPPFGFLAAPRPALLQPFLPRGRSVLISRGPTAAFLSPAPTRTLPWTSSPARLGAQVGSGSGSRSWVLTPHPPTLGGAMKTHSATFVAAPSVFSRCGPQTRCRPLF